MHDQLYREKDEGFSQYFWPSGQNSKKQLSINDIYSQIWIEKMCLKISKFIANYLQILEILHFCKFLI